MRIALGQLDCRLGDKTANALRLREAAGAALDGGADLLVVPELQLSGYALAASSADATATVEEVAETLSGTRLAVLAGFHERAGDSTYNSAGYFADGVPVHVHRKLYLCDYAPFDEHSLFAPGDSLRAFDTPFGRMATLICNDAWQPFLPALAVHDGAEILLFPAASSTVVPGVERDWRDLTRFYARMLECYVVFANRVGSEAGFTFWGGSHIVDPAGEIVAEAPLGEQALVEAEIDVGLVGARRRELPLVGALRPELLRVELERLSAVRA